MIHLTSIRDPPVKFFDIPFTVTFPQFIVMLSASTSLDSSFIGFICYSIAFPKALFSAMDDGDIFWNSEAGAFTSHVANWMGSSSTLCAARIDSSTIPYFLGTSFLSFNLRAVLTVPSPSLIRHGLRGGFQGGFNLHRCFQIGAKSTKESRYRHWQSCCLTGFLTGNCQFRYCNRFVAHRAMSSALLNMQFPSSALEHKTLFKNYAISQ